MNIRIVEAHDIRDAMKGKQLTVEPGERVEVLHGETREKLSTTLIGRFENIEYWEGPYLGLNMEANGRKCTVYMPASHPVGVRS